MRKRPAITFPHDEWQQIHCQLRELLVHEPAGSQRPLSDEDQSIVEQIRVRTAEHNRNNITRTNSYFDFYLQHPEVHWSLLAHMVSRNGGWNMTDLKGELLSKLLDPNDISQLFHFLERTNAYIFQDAYPQLLLYSESMKQNRPLYYLPSCAARFSLYASLLGAFP